MIVVDASVGIKWLHSDEAYAPQAKRLYRDHIEGENPIIVPSLFFLEIANVLAVTKGVSEETMRSGLALLNKSKISIHSFTKDNLLECAQKAKKYHTTVYDMLYAVVASEQKCTLITADERFYEKTQFVHVKLLQSMP